MSVKTVTRTVNVSAAEAWGLIDDFTNIYKFHPAVGKSIPLNGQLTGVGAERQCQLYDGNKVNERIVSYVPGKSMSVEIFEGTMPLKSATAHLSVMEKGPQETEVTITMDFTPKFGPLGAVMGEVMMKPMFGGILGNLIKGMEDHIKTGKIVGKNGTLLDHDPMMAAAA